MYGLLPWVSKDEYLHSDDWEYVGEMYSYDGLDLWDIVRYADGSYAYTSLSYGEDD